MAIFWTGVAEIVLKTYGQLAKSKNRFSANHRPLNFEPDITKLSIKSYGQ